MKNFINILFLGIGVALVSSVNIINRKDGSKCIFVKADLTIAIDNSNEIISPVFNESKRIVKEFLRLISDENNVIHGNVTVSVNTFGTNTYDDEEVEFSRNTTKLLEGVDKLQFHGDQYPRIDLSLHRFQSHRGRRTLNKIFLYVGNGDSRNAQLLQEKVDELKRRFDFEFFALYLDEKKSQTRSILDLLATPFALGDYNRMWADHMRHDVACLPVLQIPEDL